MIYWIIAVHFVFDWILQPRSVARRKASSWLWMGKHLLIILIGFTLLAYIAKAPIYYGLIFTLFHGIQDKMIWWPYRKLRIPRERIWMNFMDDPNDPLGIQKIYHKEIDNPAYIEYLNENKFAEDYWWYFCVAIDQILHLTIAVYLFT